MSEPATIRLGDNAIYALRLAEGGVLLVDAGPDFDGAWDDAQVQAAAHGFTPSDVRAVLITHGHIDHAGLAHRWAAAGARILVGTADVAILVGEGPRGAESRDARRDELLRHGAPPSVLAAVRSTRAATSGRPELLWTALPSDAVEPIADGATFALESSAEGSDELRVIAAPGHTPGNLVAFIDRCGDLYSGDTLLPETIPTAGLHFPVEQPSAKRPWARWPSLPAFIDSVDRLNALPVRRVLPGHGEPVTDPERLFTRFQRHNERRGGRVRALLAEQPDSAHGIVRRLFRRLPETRIAQAMTEVIGHLDGLLASGSATCAADDAGVLIYRMRE